MNIYSGCVTSDEVRYCLNFRALSHQRRAVLNLLVFLQQTHFEFHMEDAQRLRGRTDSRRELRRTCAAGDPLDDWLRPLLSGGQGNGQHEKQSMRKEPSFMPSSLDAAIGQPEKKRVLMGPLIQKQ